MISLADFVDKIPFPNFLLQNKKVQNEVDKRLKDLMNNKEAEQKITAAIYYDIKRFLSWLNSYWDPNPIHRNPKFKGLIEFYEMDQDSKILGNFNQRKDTLINKHWLCNPAVSDDEQEIIKAGFATYCLNRIKGFNKKKRGILSDMDYGYSVTEKVLGFEDVRFPIHYKKDGKDISRTITIKNALIVKELINHVPTLFSFDGKRNMYYGVGGSLKPRLVTPAEQVNLIRSTFDDRFGSPYGWPLKVAVFPHRVMKKASLAWRLVYLEKHGIPTVVGAYPAGTNPEDKALGKFEQSLK